MNDFISWADRRHFISVRAVTLYITLWLTWESFHWAAEFAMATAKDGVQVGLIIAAVTAPVAALQGFVFKAYMDSK